MREGTGRGIADCIPALAYYGRDTVSSKSVQRPRTALLAGGDVAPARAPAPTSDVAPTWMDEKATSWT
jgi:hypothetical protein